MMTQPATGRAARLEDVAFRYSKGVVARGCRRKPIRLSTDNFALSVLRKAQYD